MQLPPELLAQIQEALANGTLILGNPMGRSQPPRQLHDLTMLPTKDDARPTFFWSAEKPRNVDVSKVSEFPKLMWHGQTGQEVTVLSVEGQAEKVKFGYVFTAPHRAVLDPIEQLRQDWESLSPEDQSVIMKAQKEDRIAALTQRLSALDPEQLDALMANASKKRKVN